MPAGTRNKTRSGQVLEDAGVSAEGQTQRPSRIQNATVPAATASTDRSLIHPRAQSQKTSMLSKAEPQANDRSQPSARVSFPRNGRSRPRPVRPRRQAVRIVSVPPPTTPASWSKASIGLASMASGCQSRLADSVVARRRSGLTAYLTMHHRAHSPSLGRIFLPCS